MARDAGLLTETRSAPHTWGTAPEFVGPRHELRERLLFDMFLAGSPGRRVLNVGAGQGSFTLLLEEHGFEVVSTDVTDPALQVLRERVRGEVALADMTALPFADESFDAVVAGEVIEHIEDDRLAVREAARVLRSEGVLVLSVPAHPTWFGRKRRVGGTCEAVHAERTGGDHRKLGTHARVPCLVGVPCLGSVPPRCLRQASRPPVVVRPQAARVGNSGTPRGVARRQAVRRGRSRVPRLPRTRAEAPAGQTEGVASLSQVKVLVTGGAGFIGSHVVDALLVKGHEVRVLDSLEPQVHDGVPAYLSDAADFVRGDVRDHEVVRRSLEGVDRIAHLAAAVGVGQSMYEIERYTSMNAVGAAVVLEEAVRVRDRIEKLVVASSMSIYGEGLYRCVNEGIQVSPPPRQEKQLRAREWEPRCASCGAELEPLPTTEATPITPESIYAIGKRDHEEMFLVTGRAYGFLRRRSGSSTSTVRGRRSSNPYTGVAAIFSSRLLGKRPPIIFEDGRQSRDFVHVSDIAAAVVAALEPGAGDGEALNIGTGRSVTISDVADVLSRELGVDVAPEVRNEYRAGDIRHCFADISRARASLGYSPGVTFEEGMRELVAWLAGMSAVDRVDEATAALEERGLTI